MGMAEQSLDGAYVYKKDPRVQQWTQRSETEPSEDMQSPGTSLLQDMQDDMQSPGTSLLQDGASDKSRDESRSKSIIARSEKAKKKARAEEKKKLQENERKQKRLGTAAE